MKDFFLKEFEGLFGTSENAEVYFAPGRVNLIGEHTDYNGGYVFPCALTFGTYAVARKREDTLVKMYSNNIPESGIIVFDLNENEYLKQHNWSDYPKGTMLYFEKSNFEIDRGLEILFYGDIPKGAGLSSSASIELAAAVMLNDLFGFNAEMMDMVKICKAAENNFVGVNCGIMDQFAIGMGRENQAVLLDTNTLKYEYVNVDLGDSSIIIANTNKSRGLSDSKYNERRSQCERALMDLQSKLDISSLGELTEDEFEANAHLIKDQTNVKRARHAVYENRRTLRAVKALRENDIKTFGRLMNESHISLRDDYEVTGVELDTLAELAWAEEGVTGSRMTGAGFGGCTVSIVENKHIEGFTKNVGRKYAEKIGYEASFYAARIGGGAGKIK